MTSHRIRVQFNRWSVTGDELRYVQESLASGRTAGDGMFTEKCHRLLEELLGAPRVLLTTSGTTALELAALLLNLAPGDEVIMPSFTFASAANAVVLRGARPVFADIRPDTLNLDERLVEGLVTPHTRAIMPTHYAGIGCEMVSLLDVARRHGLEVVEDNAHGLFGRYRGQPLGTFGGLAVQSFHETKNISCGEGGALVINDRRYIDRAEILREKGTDRPRMVRGLVDTYSWVDVGSSALPSDVLAALLYAQLERRADIQAWRRRIWECYARELPAWAERRGIRLPVIPTHCEQPYHLFYLVTESPAQRTRLIAHLKERGVAAHFHYLPLHLSRMGRRLGGRPGDCPVTENLSGRLLRLPLHSDLAEVEWTYVIESVRAFDV